MLQFFYHFYHAIYVGKNLFMTFITAESCFLRISRQFIDFAGNYCKASACLTCSCGFNAGIKGKQICLRSYFDNLSVITVQRFN